MKHALALASLFACSTTEAPPSNAPGPSSDAIETESKAHSHLPLTGEWLQVVRNRRGRVVGVVAVPLGTTAAQRVIVGVHGAQSRPDYMCSVLRSALGPGNFIFCPHTLEQMEQNASWSGDELCLRTEEGLAALRETYVANLDATRVTYFGHSQGAMTVPYAFAGKPSTIDWGTVIFFEGLPREPERVTPTLRAMGADHVVLISGQRGWESGHHNLAASLTRSGIPAEHIAASFGHFATPEVLREVLGSSPSTW